LQQAVSQRRDASGNDFFVNTGSTNQQGIEALIRYAIINSNKGFFNQLSFSGSYALQDFTYRDYQVIEAKYSGNRLPGNAKNYTSLMLDATLAKAFYLNATYSYSDKIYLNDANTDGAASYQLLALRIGWKKVLAHHELNIFGGADNLFNETYSLGNDINAAVGRYYNASPGRNYFVGIGWRFKK
jgi:iron complex outermembrane receptor protein